MVGIQNLLNVSDVIEEAEVVAEVEEAEVEDEGIDDEVYYEIDGDEGFGRHFMDV